MTENNMYKKGWGYEKWIVNKPEYCGKLLFFEKGKRCSLHYHLLKDETFYVHQGKVEMWWTDHHTGLLDVQVKAEDRNALNKIILTDGDSFYVPRKRIHQVIALEDTTVYEFSTEHFDSDSYRILKGD